ncbi:2-isopropylmalate synthase [Variovorax sp. PBL-E5]|nr:2-isopropylmalate synthase [Variovorax sp. PBL-E5]
MDEIDELVGGIAIECAAVLDRIDQVGSDVVFDNLGQQTVHCPAAGGDQVHDLGAAHSALQPALDGIDLTADAAHPVQKLLLLVDGVAHGCSDRVGGYPIRIGCGRPAGNGPIHPRHPYVGDLVFTAFSGSHQDAIKKGFAAQAEDGPWQVPYLPIDPKDLGRTYDSIVRVNSQSGKGGIAFLLERDHGVVMPRRMQVEFSAIVQKVADASEAEVSGSMLWALFEQTYLAPAVDPEGSLVYRGHRLFDDPAGQGIELDLVIDARPCRVRGVGTGPLEATVHALGTTLRVDSFEERSLGQGAEASALAIVEMAMRGVNGTRFGVGRNVNTLTASVQAVISAVARLKAASSGTAAVR